MKVPRHGRRSLVTERAAISRPGSPGPHCTVCTNRYPPGILGNLADWGALGSALGGLATLVLAAAIIGGMARLQDWRARQRAEKALAEEQAESIRLERRRVLEGWPRHGVNMYGPRSSPPRRNSPQAVKELSVVGPTDYVVLRVPGLGGNRAESLRQLVEREGNIARAPAAGEYEALKQGIRALGED